MSLNEVGEITELTPAIFEAYIGQDWNKRKHRHVKFNAPPFNLESLYTQGSCVGILHSELNFSLLESLDVSNNSLISIDVICQDRGFLNLRVIKARRNHIADVHLDLPMLMELNLSYNNLSVIPKLTNVRNLEVLILGNNELSGPWNALSEVKQLKRLDMSYNNFSIKPSELEEGLGVLCRLNGLTNLKLKGNPFALIFDMYQVFCVQEMPSLSMLDDLPISPEIRAESSNYHISSLGNYDDSYKKKREEYEAQKSQQASLMYSGDLPLFDGILAELENAILDGTTAARVVHEVCQAATSLCNMDQEMVGGMFQCYDKVQNRTEAVENAIARFYECLDLLMERHDSCKQRIVQIFALLTAIHHEDLGTIAWQHLAQVMTSSPDHAAQVFDKLASIVIPNLERRKADDAGASIIIKGLAALPCEEGSELEEELQTLLGPLVPQMAEWFHPDDLNADILSLLALSTSNLESAKLAIELGTPDKVMASLENKQLVQQSRMRPMYLSLIRILRHTAAVGKDIVVHYAKNAAHTKLIQQLKSFLTDPLVMTPIDLVTASEIMEAITTIITADEDVLMESVENYKLLDMLVVAPKEHMTDPLVLGSSLKGILVVLEVEAMRDKYLKDLVEVQLQCLKPMLQYLGQKKYSEFYAKAMRHMPEEVDHEEGGGGRDKKVVVAPALPGLTNQAVHKAFVAIVQFIGWFAERMDNLVCNTVNEAMDASNREFVLLSLLDVPCDALRKAVMKCIRNVPFSQIQSEEIGQMVKFLGQATNLGAGETEEILSLLILELQEIMDDNETEAGRAMRQDHGANTIKQVFEILWLNSARKTYGNLAEEKEKTTLSRACVKFMRSASRFSELHKFLRTKDSEEHVRNVLVNEEQLHSPANRDICPERGWSGRSTEILLRCFMGVRCLNAKQKVAFRVMQRIADVLEGCSDRWDPELPTVHALAESEAEMWNAHRIKNKLRKISDDEWDDRSTQQKKFLAAQGISHILSYLTKSMVVEVEETGEEEENEAYNFMSQMAGEAHRHSAEKSISDQEKLGTEQIEELSIEDLLGLDDLGSDGDDEGEDMEPSNPSRKILMGSFQQYTPPARFEDCELFARKLPEFEVNEEFFLNDGTDSGFVNPSFIVASFLRQCYIMLRHPVVDHIRDDIVKFLRKEHVIRQCLSLVAVCGFLDCSVAAKYLCVLRCSLRLPDNDAEEAMESMLLFEIITQNVMTLCSPCLQALKQTQNRAMSKHEQVLCAEVAQLMDIIARNIAQIHFGAHVELQAFCVQQCAERFIPHGIITTVIHMILYDLQIDGGGNDAITTDFVRAAIERQAMRTSAASLLAQYILECPNMKYIVLEAFSHAVIFGKQTLRPSFMFGLLELLCQGDYVESITELLVNKYGRPEKVFKIYAVDVLVSGGTLNRKLIVSNYNVYIMNEPDPRSRCKICPPERFCPHEPRVEAMHPYKDISRLVRGFGPQLLTVGWVDSTGSEELQSFMCHSGHDRDRLLESLHELSACTVASDLSDRVKIFKDNVTGPACHAFVDTAGEQGPEPAQVLAFQCAKRVDKGGRVSLFVVTGESMFELALGTFAPFFSCVGGPLDGEESDDEVGPVVIDAEDLLANKHHGHKPAAKKPRTGGHHAPKAQSAKQKALRDRREKAKKAGDEALLKTVNSTLLGVQNDVPAEEQRRQLTERSIKYLLGQAPLLEAKWDKLKEMAFLPGDIPKVRLDIGGESVVVEFFDDGLREDWRCAMACALASPAASKPWGRTQVSADKVLGCGHGH